MIPVLVLTTVTLLLRALGTLGLSPLASWDSCLRGGFAAMFVLTASAHWGRRRPDLIRMVPDAFPRPDLLVTATGLLELLGAAGLLLPSTARWAAACLALLLLALFPANVRAARQRLTIGGQPVTPLGPRTALQAGFIGGLAAIATGAFS